jgi:hypothetical protein
MGRGFEILAIVAWLASSAPARAASPAAPAAPAAPAPAATDVCQTRDDKADAAAVDSYFVAHLREHSQQPFARPLIADQRARAKSFLEQRIGDKRAEVCAARLKLAEDIKTAPAKYATAECGAAAVAGLIDEYAVKVAGTYKQNQQLLQRSLLAEHLKTLQKKLFEIARGSARVEGSFQGRSLASAPREVRFEWVKQEATRLGGEARVIWGAANPDANPLLQRNLIFAREAVRAKQELDSAKARYHTSGKLLPSCQPK